MSADKSGSASGSTPLLPDEYGTLIDSVRETANTMIPRNATVLVVSRGDDELVRIGPRRALHFPQDEFGRYAGYHPEDSEAAIAALEEMRARGAEYLLLPSTSFWWLDYYEGLREHLQSNYPAIASGDECMVFELLSTGAQTAPGDADTSEVPGATQTRQLAAPLDDLLRALLPRDARVVIAAAGDLELPSFGNTRAVAMSDGQDGLAALFGSAGDADFVVVPATAYDRLYGGQEPASAIGQWTLVTRQQHMCEVWERVPADTATTAPPPEPSTPQPPARPSLWQRLVRFLRRR